MTEAIEADDEKLYEKMVKTQDDRLFYVSEAIRRGIPIEEIADLTKSIFSSLISSFISLKLKIN